MTLSDDELLRRFLLHVLPRGFVRIRHYGFLSSRHRGELVPLCKQILSEPVPTPVVQELKAHSPTTAGSPAEAVPMWICPLCGGPMVIVERLTAGQILLRAPPRLEAA